MGFRGVPMRGGQLVVTLWGRQWSRAALPHHITWRQLGTVAYVVAMEPSTNRDAAAGARELAAAPA